MHCCMCPFQCLCTVLLYMSFLIVHKRNVLLVCPFQSGEAGATLAFTIIPIHDDNIDLNFEPVSQDFTLPYHF